MYNYKNPVIEEKNKIIKKDINLDCSACKYNCNYSNTSNYDCKDKYFEDSCGNIASDENYNCNCSCGFEENSSIFPMNPMYGQSYVPFQQINKTFLPEVGLKMGTIFPELVSPYKPFQSIEEINYIKATNTIGEGCNG